MLNQIIEFQGFLLKKKKKARHNVRKPAISIMMQGNAYVHFRFFKSAKEYKLLVHLPWSLKQDRKRRSVTVKCINVVTDKIWRRSQAEHHNLLYESWILGIAHTHSLISLCIPMLERWYSLLL
jgi:hypothetical protein